MVSHLGLFISSMNEINDLEQIGLLTTISFKQI